MLLGEGTLYRSIRADARTYVWIEEVTPNREDALQEWNFVLQRSGALSRSLAPSASDLWRERQASGT